MLLRWCMILTFAVLLNMVTAVVTPLHADTLRIVGAQKIDDTLRIQLLVKIYSEVSRRSGHQLKYIRMPSKRASLVAALGHIDGELARAESYGASQPNLVPVLEAPVRGRFAAYTRKDKSWRFTSWNDLWGSSLKIGYRRGFVRAQTKLDGRVPAANLFIEKTMLDGLRKLASGRLDVFIAIPAYVDGLFLQHPELREQVQIAGTLEVFSTYMFLHKKHRTLASEFARHIRDMKAEGLIRKYADEVYGAANAAAARKNLLLD